MVEVGRVTALIDGDISPLNSALSLARQSATDAVSGIERGVKGQVGSGLTNAVDWAGLGKNTAGNYISGLTAGLGPIGTALDGVATALGPTGMIATAAIAGSAVVIKAAWDASSAWEMGLSQISKTTGIEKGTWEFDKLNEDLKDLYSTMPTTAAEIQNVAKAAGSLGIESNSIAGFTQVALEMGSAFDISAEKAAVSVGKVQSQLKALPEGISDSAEFARNFGSAVDYAGNSMNATEEEVLDFSTRTAGALSLLGGTAYEIAGWGGATASVFSSSQLAAGSFNAALTNLTGTTKGSINAQNEAAELLGITAEEFLHLMATDPTDTVLRLGNALEGLDPEEATKAAYILGSGYGDDFFKKMIGHTDEWRGKIEEVVEAGEKGESIGRSFESGSDNAKSAIQELKNSVNAILIDIGGPIGDAFTPIIRGVTDGLNDIREIGENLWGPFTTAIGPMTDSLGTVVGLVGTLAGYQLDGLVLASQTINTAFETGSAYAGAFQEEIGKIISNTTAFQTTTDTIEDVTTAIGDLGDGAAEVFSKVVDGFTNAIPTAITGTAGAIGTLLDKAGLGGVADMADGIVGFFQDVDENAAKKLGKDTGEKIAAGIKDSKLSDAPGEALSSQEAMAGVEKAAAQLGTVISDPVYWKDIPIAQSIDAATGRVYGSQRGAKWKEGLDEAWSVFEVGGVEIAAEKKGTNKDTWIVLTSENGVEIDRRNIHHGEFAGDEVGAIYDMLKENPEFTGLSDIESAEAAGDWGTVDKLKLSKAGVDVEMDTEARLKELSSLDIDQLRANITEIEAEIAGLSRGLRDIDTAFEEMSIEPINMTVALNTTQAREDWDILVRDIQGMTVRLPVELDVTANASEIRAIIAEELRAMVR